MPRALVNLATSTAAAAAAEVAYTVQSLGSSLYAIEIGNECDLYGGRPTHWPPAAPASLVM